MQTRRMSLLAAVAVMAAMVQLTPAAASSGARRMLHEEDHCSSGRVGKPNPEEVFKFSINFFASATGYFEVEGYEGVQPTLTMKVGKTYTFDQTNQTNWYHPLGFAYYPDGAHEGVDEVEGDSLVYLINGVQPEENLDGYEPEFFLPRDVWMEKEYSVQLTITPEIVAQAQGGEIYYFCHIHNRMSGRILLVNEDGSPIETNTTAPELYEPVANDEFDTMCGTYEASAFQAGEDSPCGETRFICSAQETDAIGELGNVTMFADCMQAIDCKMVQEMKVHEVVESPTATFMHQMIPHHANAVNMAKVLLKYGGEEVLDEEIMGLIYDIINNQNYQITFMEGWLRDNGYSTYVEASCVDGNMTDGEMDRK